MGLISLKSNLLLIPAHANIGAANAGDSTFPVTLHLP